MCSNIPFWALSFSAAYLHPRVQCSADSGVHQSPLQVLLQQVLVQVWPGARALAFLHSSGAAGAAGLDLALETTVMFQLLSVFPFSIGAPWRLGFFCFVPCSILSVCYGAGHIKGPQYIFMERMRKRNGGRGSISSRAMKSLRFHPDCELASLPLVHGCW